MLDVNVVFFFNVFFLEFLRKIVLVLYLVIENWI